MEELELTPVELMSALNWKKSKVYYWIQKGKFKTVERMGITKVVISQKDFDSLKIFEDTNHANNSDNFSENFNISDNFQNGNNSNVTKHYENVQKNLYEEQIEFFKSTLETIKQIHTTASQNYNNSLKMLTDSQSNLEQEHFKLQAEYKTVQSKLDETESEYKKVSENLKQTELEKTEQFEKFRKVQIYKNISIIVLSILLLFSLVGFVFVLNNPKPKEEVSNQPEPEIVQPIPQPKKIPAKK
jgi:hypothetical protein